VEGVRIHFVAPIAAGAQPGGAGAQPGAAGAQPGAAAAALNLAAPVLDAGPGQPEIIARSAWAGAHARPVSPPFYGSIRLAFVHHTDNPNGYGPGEVPAMLLAIFDYHRFVRGYRDIAYNFIIDAFGRIWEARAGGIDEPVLGAHAGGFNAVSTGVAVLGTFMSAIPPPPALDALNHLLAWKLSLHGVPVLGRVGVRVNSADAFYTPFAPRQLVHLDRVSGHRDGDLTDCPGNAFYGRLGSLRPQIAALTGTPAKLSIAASPATVTPGGSVTLSGGLTMLNGGQPLAGAPIEVQRIAGGAETTIATAVTDATGAWSLPVTVARDEVLRALHRPAPASVSELVAIGVVPVLTLALAGSSPPRVSGTIVPAKATVVLDTYELSGRGHRRLLNRRRVRVRGGRFGARVPGARRGRRLAVVARTAEGGGSLAGQSPTVLVSL
jgi:hypothetical protein